MIQRIQTVHLLIAAALLGLFLFFVDSWLGGLDGAFPWLRPAAYVLGGLTTALALVSVFLYQNRARQSRAIFGAQMADLALVAVLAVALALSAFGESATEADLARASIVFLPALAYVFFSLARRGVRRDIELIRSMDRLR